MACERRRTTLEGDGAIRSAQRIVGARRSCAAPRGRERQKRLDDWLAELGGRPRAGLRRLFAGASAGARAACSALPTARRICGTSRVADPARLVPRCSNPIRTPASTPSSPTRVAAIAATRDEAEVMRLLRRMRAEASLLIALADIGGVWPVMRVTAALTELADAAVGAAVRYLLAARRAARASFEPADSAQPEDGAATSCWPWARWARGELNYSSDIDLIVFYDAAAPALAPGIEPAPFWIRITRGLVKLLQERTADGYVFRTDLRLRPDPASTQIAVSTAAALDYYESVGRNWERAAMIKARACAGDIAAGKKLLRELSPFIWRKYLDFAAVADIHDMKRQIHAYRGHGEIAVEGHNVKLGRGGIREIEFFVQTQQLIAGGRHPELRGRETLAMLDRARRRRLDRRRGARELDAAYRFLRTVEHRLQMVADEQTHTLPARPRGARALRALLRLCRPRQLCRNAARPSAATCSATMRPCSRARPPPRRAPARSSFPPERDDRETLDKLTAMGFKQPLEASAHVRHWLAGGYRSLEGEHARTQLAELVPLLLTHFARSSNPDAALLAFDRFLSGPAWRRPAVSRCCGRIPT